MNFPKKVLNFRFLLEKQTEIVIIKDLIYHPQPKKGSRTVQMGQNMTQNESKNSLKQPPPKKKRKKKKISIQFLPSVWKSHLSQYVFPFSFLPLTPLTFFGWVWHFCSLMIICDHISVPFAIKSTH
jgi:hypothetical protein